MHLTGLGQGWSLAVDEDEDGGVGLSGCQDARDVHVCYTAEEFMKILCLALYLT